MMHTLFSELEAAMSAEMTSKVLDLLVEIAQFSVEHDDKGFAIEILALALQYPMNLDTLDAAEMLYSSLEMELCPRVMSDAYDLAQQITLEDMVERVLARSGE